MKRYIRFTIIYMFIILITACSSTNRPETDEISQVISTISPKLETPQTSIIVEGADIYTTQNNLSGNHLVDGSIDLVNAELLDIPLNGNPMWLVSAPFKGSIIFVAIMEDGNAQAFKISEDTFEPFDISPAQLPEGMPPTLAVTDESIQLITPPDDASPITNPILVDGNLIYIASNGDLVVSSSESQTRLPINALPDSRILVDDDNRLVVLTEPTNRYDHGIAGDELEASAIALVEMEPEIHVIQTFTIEAHDVIEGISALWADIDNDGERDIIVTLSNKKSGSRIAAYREDRTLLAESDPIGLGHRWRHQIAVTEFGANQSPLLVDVRTPHIGGILEFLQFKDRKLEVVFEIQSFGTHTIRTRNLDSALAGDFNNDGIVELLAPDQGHTNLGIISLEGVIAFLPLNGVLTTNLSAADLNGQLYIGAGTQDNLRIWVP